MLSRSVPLLLLNSTTPPTTTTAATTTTATATITSVANTQTHSNLINIIPTSALTTPITNTHITTNTANTTVLNSPSLLSMTDSIMNSPTLFITKNPIHPSHLSHPLQLLDWSKQKTAPNTTTTTTTATPNTTTTTTTATTAPTQSYRVVIKNPEEVRKKLDKLKADGAAKLQVISDFDMTLTKFRVNGERGMSSHGIIEHSHMLDEQYHIQTNQLFQKYYPIEVDSVLTPAEKIPLMEEW